MTPSSSWRPVKSSANPADCASRGLLPSELKNHPLWFSGPYWLSLPSSEWPKSDIGINKQYIPDLKSETLSFITTSVTEQSFICFERFSTWTRLNAVFAYILRFVHNCKTQKSYQDHSILRSFKMQNYKFQKLYKNIFLKILLL